MRRSASRARAGVDDEITSVAVADLGAADARPRKSGLLDQRGPVRPRGFLKCGRPIGSSPAATLCENPRLAHALDDGVGVVAVQSEFHGQQHRIVEVGGVFAELQFVALAHLTGAGLSSTTTCRTNWPMWPVRSPALVLRAPPTVPGMPTSVSRPARPWRAVGDQSRHRRPGAGPDALALHHDLGEHRLAEAKHHALHALHHGRSNCSRCPGRETGCVPCNSVARGRTVPHGTRLREHFGRAAQLQIGVRRQRFVALRIASNSARRGMASSKPGADGCYHRRAGRMASTRDGRGVRSCGPGPPSSGKILDFRRPIVLP